MQSSNNFTYIVLLGIAKIVKLLKLKILYYFYLQIYCHSFDCEFD